MKNAIIFDLDGTLWDTSNQSFISFNEVLKKHGYDEVTKSKVNDNFGNTKDQAIKHFFPTLPYETGNNLLEEIDINIIENIGKNDNPIYDGVSDALELLSRKYNLYIVSNNAHSTYIEKFLEMGNYFNYFRGYIAASELSLRKSDAIQKIINDNKIEKAIYVGDTDKDKEAADINNIAFVQCLYGFGKDLNCKYKINSILELCNCVDFIFDDQF